jgi:hypothetical protein
VKFFFPPIFFSSSTGGSSGGAPTNAPYLLTSSNSTLTGASVIAAGSNITLTFSGGNLTVSAAGGGYPSGTYVTQANETSNLPNSFKLVAGAGISLTAGTNTLTIGSSGAGLGTVTNFSAGIANPIFTTSVSNPTSTPALSFLLSSAPSGQFLAGPVTGSAATPYYRLHVGSDLISALSAGSNITLTLVGSSLVIASSGGSGTVSSFTSGNAGGLFTTSVATPTSTPNLTFTVTSQASGQVYAGPISGGNATPGFRPLTASDVVPTLTAGSNINISSGGTISATGLASGSVTSVAVGNLSPIFTSTTATSTTTPSTTFSLTNQASGQFLAGPASGTAGAPSYRGIISNDIFGNFNNGSGISLSNNGSQITITATNNASGSVTSVSDSGLTGLFTSSTTNPTTTPVISHTLSSQSSGQIFASPSSTSGTPNFRAMVLTDLPQGNSPGQLLIGSATGWVPNSLTAGSNINIGNSDGNIIISSTSSGNGSVTSVSSGNLAPIFTSAVSNPTTAPSISYTISNAASATFLAGPTSGSSTAPTYRTLNSNDLIGSLAAGANINFNNSGGVLTISAVAGSGSSSGTVTNFSAGSANPVFTTSVANSTTTPVLSFSLSNTASGQILSGPASGAVGSPSYRNLVGYDLGSIIQAGTNVTVNNNGSNVIISAAGSSNTSGTVTSFSAGTANPIFTTSVSTSNTTPTLSFNLSSAASGTFLSGPASGSPNSPIYRNIVGSDLTNAITVSGSNLSLTNNGNTLNIISNAGSSNTNGTVTSVALSLPNTIFTVSGSPVINSGTLTGTFVNQASGLIFAGPASGGNAAPTFRNLTGSDLTGALAAGNNITLTNNGSVITIASTASGGGSGTVSSVSASSSIPSIAVNVTNSTSTPQINLSAVGTMGDIPYFTNANVESALGVGLTSQAIGVVNGLPAYVNLFQGFASATVSATLTNTSPGYQNMDASTAPVTLILPAASSVVAEVFYFNNNTVTGTNACTVTTNGTDTFDGGSTSKTMLKFQVMGVISDGISGWRTIKPQIASVYSGGTGVSTVPTDGQIPIGSTSGGSYSPANITGVGITVSNAANSITLSNYASGALTSVGLTTDNVIFTSPATNSPLTANGTLQLSLINQASGTGLFGPTTGAANKPTFRAPVATDIYSALTNALVAGSNTTLTLNSTNSTITIASTASGGGGGGLPSGGNIGQTIQNTGSGTGAWVNSYMFPSITCARPRRWGTYSYPAVATTSVYFSGGLNTVSPTNSGTATTLWGTAGLDFAVNFATSTTSGTYAGSSSQANANWGVFNNTYPGPRYIATIRTGSSSTDIQNCRIWVGMLGGGAAYCTGTNTPGTAVSVAAFRYSPAVDATQYWRCVTGTGSAQNVITTTVPINYNTVYTMAVDCSIPGTVSFYISTNGGASVLAASTTTDVPISGVACNVETITTLSTTAVNIATKSVFMDAE